MKKNCCDMRGMLSFLILFLLSKKEMNGVEISEEIKKRKGTKPSPGTIYPALKNLRQMNFIKEEKKGSSIKYKITKEGEKAFKTAKIQFCSTFMDII